MAQAAATSIPLPFAAGTAVRVLQGYNGGTHQGASQYGLDLVLAQGETSGEPALSPLEGTVAWAFEPGTRTGCVEIVARDGQFGTMLCHVLLDRSYQRGERIARGQVLGTVGAPGAVGNNGTAHIHLELHRGGRDNQPVPFGGEGGVPLEDLSLPSTGTSNEYAGGRLTSTNEVSPPPQPELAPAVPRGGASAARAPTVSSPAPRLVLQANRCLADTLPGYRQGFADLKVYLGDRMGAPTTCEFPDPLGTGDVLQQTTAGLAFWRKNTNMPTFTNGADHWAHTLSGWTSWTGASIDPPPSAMHPAADG